MSYFTLNTVSELLCFLIALICVSTARRAAWRLMAPFMGITCLAEFSGIYVASVQGRNYWVYILFIPVEIATYSFMFYHLLKEAQGKSWLTLLGLILLVLAFGYDRVRVGLSGSSFITYCLFSVLMTLYSCYYLYLLMKREQSLNLLTSAAFWWVAGTLLYHFAKTTFNTFWLVISDMHLSRNGPVAITFKVLNVLLYSCWSYAFICKRWFTQTSHD